jgi:succinate-semialdehyde dehydrogenase / glutarate-semialdehyde dehydrogenase
VINTVPDTDEAVRRANGTAFGLGSSVYSARRGPAISSIPFGGVGESGFGRFHGDAGLREFSHAKSTTRKRFSLGQDLQSFPRTPEQFDVVRKTLRLRYGRTLH